MGSLKIISADERLSQAKGAKILIVGQSGIGKTSLLKTVDPASTLFVDLEAGDLAIGKTPIDQVSPETWQDCRNLAVFLAGPDPQAKADDVYGKEHYDHAVALYGDTDLGKYSTLLIALLWLHVFAFVGHSNNQKAQTQREFLICVLLTVLLVAKWLALSLSCSLPALRMLSLSAC